MPNPYTLPGTHFSVDFENERLRRHVIPLSIVDVRNCLLQARQSTLHEIQEHGNREIPLRPQRLIFRQKSVWLMVEHYNAVVEEMGFSYADTLLLLDAIQLRMSDRGYRRLSGRIVENHLPRSTSKWIGNVLLAPKEEPLPQASSGLAVE